jgi:exodeoxyribonuclease VII large subunit
VALRPATVAARLADGEARLASLWRLAQSLHPDRPLSRGYARVEAGGRTVASAAAARALRDFRVVFADGGVEVAPLAPASTPAPPPPPPPRRERARDGAANQPRLL